MTESSLDELVARTIQSVEDARRRGKWPELLPRPDQLVQILPTSSKFIGQLADASADGASAVCSLAERSVDSFREGKLTRGDFLSVLLALRAYADWNAMVYFVEAARRDRTSAPDFDGREEEQLYAMALNRIGRDQCAEEILTRMLKSYGDDPETLGILGRVYKDRFAKSDNADEQAHWLNVSAQVYLRGVLSNGGEVYPLVNAVTLLSVMDHRSPHADGLVRHLTYLLDQRFHFANVDYFDFASSLEMAVVLGSRSALQRLMPVCLSTARGAWELYTTSNNLRILTRSPRLDVSELASEIAAELHGAAENWRAGRESQSVGTDEISAATVALSELFSEDVARQVAARRLLA